MKIVGREVSILPPKSVVLAVLGIGFLFGACFTLSNNIANGDSSGWFWEDELTTVCCPLDGQDYHHNPHPDKGYFGTMSILSASGLQFFHYKVGIAGQETRCGGHDEKLDKGLPCDNLGMELR